MFLAHRWLVSFSLFLISPLALAFSPAPLQQKRSGPCELPAREAGLKVRDGHVEFISQEKLRPFLEGLPQVQNAEVTAAFSSPDTMWYDEESMVYLYQDSVEVVVGGRANCVGRMVGERNAGNEIGKLMEYFGPDFRFMFPFRKAAGTDDVENSHVINFWVPPKKDGQILPVKWWRKSSRGRWHWVFPVGTLFGEVLLEKSPEGQWHAFEVRTRTRYLDGWRVNLFRPFLSAASLAQAITERRPDWQNNASLARAVEHLRTPSNLTAHTLASKPFKKIFEPVQGSLDLVPDLSDASLVRELLTKYAFRSAEGAIWKEGEGMETYGPSSTSDFSIVPKGYKMGMIPVNEVSCNRCHIDTGNPIGNFEFRVVLYGEIWGEDRIFTWHLFEPTQYIYDTWDDEQQSRRINQRLVQAKLISQGKPSAGDQLYKQLPVFYQEDP